MARPVLLPLLALLLVPGATPARAAGKVTLAGLLRQMTDLGELAEYPDPPYLTRQFSSYDRASQTPEDPAGWFANYDRGFMLYDGVVTRETPYYRQGPMQGRPPDGRFPAGTRVGIAPGATHRPLGDYVWAYATGPDGRPVHGKTPQGYIPRSAIRLDPQGHVLAEMDGPGCVVRIWSADPEDAGNLRIYLDGSPKPAIEAPMRELLGGKWRVETNGQQWTPFPDPIACERSRGWNLYFPIAYAKHCKICTDRADFYYHVDYRTYPEGTQVETFDLRSLAGKRESLAQEIGLLKSPLPAGFWIDWGAVAEVAKQDGSRMEPGERRELLKLEGPRRIIYLSLWIRKAKDQAQALRSLALIGTFDGAAQPQIWCPLGDFFGSSPGTNPYYSLPFIVGRSRDEVRLVTWWPMPFEKSAVLEVHNLGKQPLVVGWRVLSRPRPWTDRTMHFHARWRTQTLNTRPFRDWTFCDLKGKGVFVGDMLSILNPTAAWWGEGDEKIYVDGESFPSWFGTGTEDYFGYAWSFPKPFQHPYHNQTRCDGPGNYGHTSVNRFHILDAIPFTKAFRFDMELWHWTPHIDVNLAATSYWYARPGATDDFQVPDARVLQTLPSPPPPFKIAGALEGEALRVLGKSSDFPVGPQDMLPFPDGKWSGNAQLWGRPPRQGEWTDLALPVAKSGQYRVLVYLTKARDYGIVEFRVNGKRLAGPLDGFQPDSVVSTGPIDLGTVDLPRGTATLRIEVVGTNPKSDGLRYMWGLDCVVLKPVSRS